MGATTSTLAEPAQATADASGNAVVRIGPRRPGVVWTVSRVLMTSTPATGTTKPTAVVYLGSAGGTNLGGTKSADALGDAVGPAVRLFPGQELVVVFAGCDAGATARIDLTGQKTELS